MPCCCVCVELRDNSILTAGMVEFVVGVLRRNILVISVCAEGDEATVGL